LAIRNGAKPTPKTGTPIFTGITKEAFGFVDASAEIADGAGKEARKRSRSREVAYLKGQVMTRDVITVWESRGLRLSTG
jgi:hypothetical protein